ncbi:MAG: hypothetical protein K6F51_12935 [Acetatifactor sp.]|nr:hypothetical protein [Acetatifactor sp.]
MKKRILLTVCFIMLLCMAGCGSPNTDVADGEEPLTVSEIVTKEDEEPVEVAGLEEPEAEESNNAQQKESDNVQQEESDNVQQDQKAWEKVVIAPPEGAYCNISFSLPEDWDYSWAQTEDVPVSSISIGIYPKAEGDAKGCIAIKYAEGFGVCGTGLESVETTFNGHVAYKGTYDDHPYWDFISLSGEYRGCSIWNYAGETWYDKYQEELEEIFATVKFELLIRDGVPLKDAFD